jgi:hypothetical protein
MTKIHIEKDYKLLERNIVVKTFYEKYEGLPELTKENMEFIFTKNEALLGTVRYDILKKEVYLSIQIQAPSNEVKDDLKVIYDFIETINTEDR